MLITERSETMQDKFHMTPKQNVALAKRNLVDNIYLLARLEGVNVTFPETYAILEKAHLANADISAVSTVLNLKHAWQKLLSSWEQPLTLDYIKGIHYEVAKDEALTWGKLRTGQVSVGGTEYLPPIPIENDVIRQIDSFKTHQSSLTDAILTMFMWQIKAQLFWDGNKRTASLIANKSLIKHGLGILTVPEKELLTFNQYLSHYYSTDESEPLKTFLYNTCLQAPNEFEIKNQEYFSIEDEWER